VERPGYSPYSPATCFVSALRGRSVARAPAIGALIMAGYLARNPIRRRIGLKMFAAVAVFGK
jgi:hypothetical protein